MNPIDISNGADESFKKYGAELSLTLYRTAFMEGVQWYAAQQESKGSLEKGKPIEHIHCSYSSAQCANWGSCGECSRRTGHGDLYKPQETRKRNTPIW